VTATTTTGRRPKQVGVPRVLLHLTLVSWGLISLAPLLWMLSASLQTNQEIYAGIRLIPASLNWDNYVEAWQKASFNLFLGNSILYTVTIVLGTVVLGAMAAYAFARLQFPGKDALYYAFLVFMFIPIPGAFIPLYVVLARLDLLNTRLGYILPMINGGIPFAIFVLRSFFEQMPREIEEAALVDGASRLQIFTRIAYPLARPAIATVVIFTVLGTWNEFVLASVVFDDRDLMPLQVGLLTFQGSYFSQYGLIMAGTTITTLPMLLVYVIFQRHIINGVMAGAVKA
jgi:ABC-type glycerol-3-phosphate transport system permease component